MNPPRRQQLKDLTHLLRSTLLLEKSFGIDSVAASGAVREKKSAPGDTLENRMDCLSREVSVCVKCPLHRTRTRTVFGEGSLKAKLLFVGEAPGSEEDRQGRPFVGQAGKLLTKIIEAMGMRREDVFIANVLKCRPPGNRSPLPEEIHSCEPYLIQQLESIRPRVICSLGKYATMVLLRKEEPISALRGNFYDYQGIPVLPTYHPAYLLRNPSAKKIVWEDMKKIKAKLESLEP